MATNYLKYGLAYFSMLAAVQPTSLKRSTDVYFSSNFLIKNIIPFNVIIVPSGTLVGYYKRHRRTKNLNPKN
jgi:hypothetical protein